MNFARFKNKIKNMIFGAKVWDSFLNYNKPIPEYIHRAIVWDCIDLPLGFKLIEEFIDKRGNAQYIRYKIVKRHKNGDIDLMMC